jgi:hypothetical protein
VGRVKLRSGVDWDNGLEGNDAPDPYVVLKTGGKSGRTKHKDNTYDHSFDQYVLTASALELGARIDYEVKDDDILSSRRTMRSPSAPTRSTHSRSNKDSPGYRAAVAIRPMLICCRSS